jgi:hypothetical protein
MRPHNNDQPVLCREIIAVYCENHTEHITILCGQNAKFSSYLTGNTLHLPSRVTVRQLQHCPREASSLTRGRVRHFPESQSAVTSPLSVCIQYLQFTCYYIYVYTI